MVINKKDIEWIKAPLNFQESDSWEKYKERLRKKLREFDIDEKESTISWFVERIEEKLEVVNRQKDLEVTEREKAIEEIKKQQERIYERVFSEMKKVIEEEEWVKKMYRMMVENEMIVKNENSLMPKLKERSFHNRSSSLPPPLRLDLKSSKEEESVYKMIKRRGSELVIREKEEREMDEQEVKVQEVQKKKIINTVDKEVQTDLTMEQLEKALEVIQAQIQILAKK